MSDKYKVPHLSMRMVRERTLTLTRKRIESSGDVAAVVSPLLLDRPVEYLVALLVGGTGDLTGMVTLSQGGMHGTGVVPRDVLRAVLAGHASAFVMAHNHPSGDPRPSRDDERVTEAVAEAARIIGVPLLDHVIVASGGFTSITVKS